MATQTIQINAIESEASTSIEIFSLISDTEEASGASTEYTNQLGLYYLDVTDLPAGDHRVQLLDSAGGKLADGYVETSATTAKFTAYSSLSSRVHGDASWTTAGSSNPALIQSTTIASVTSQTIITLTAGSADDLAYAGNSYAIIVDQVTAVQKSIVPIVGYTGATKTVTFGSAPVFTIATGDTIYVVSNEMGTVDARMVSTTVSPTTLAAAADGTLELYRGDDWSFQIEGMGDMTGYQNIWVTFKEKKTDLDASAWMQVDKATGLLVIMSDSSPTAGNASITINDLVAGDFTVAVSSVESSKVEQSLSHLRKSTGFWDAQYKDVSGLVSTPKKGVLTIDYDVTRATT